MSRRFAPSRRLMLAAALTAPLGGCFATRKGFTARAGAESLAENPVLQVLTTRRVVGPRAPFLDSARGKPSYARARLKAPDASTLGRLNALVSTDFAVQSLEAEPGPGVAGFTEALRGRDTLLYVHGYNQTFESAALEAAQLSNGIGFIGNSALFTWASKGGLLDYGYDRESALLARDPFAEALHALLTDTFGARLHLVAHSMGTLLTLETLRSFRDRHGDTGLDRLGALVLAAPDVDADLFRDSVERLGTWRAKMTVITAQNDRALDLSRRLSGNARAGALPAEALSGLGIKVIDATDFASGLVRHDVFLANADVRAVIKRAIERA